MEAHPVTWHIKLLLALMTSFVAFASEQSYAPAPLENQESHQEALVYQQPQADQDSNKVSSYQDKKYTNDYTQYQPHRLVQASSTASPHQEKEINNYVQYRSPQDAQARATASSYQDKQISNRYLKYQPVQASQVHSTASSYQNIEASNNHFQYQVPETVHAHSSKPNYQNYNYNSNYLDQNQQEYHLPDLIPHPQSRRRLERQRSRSPVNYHYSSADHDEDGYDTNPLSTLRDWWYEAWDGTSRLFDTSYTTYLWAVPLFGVLAYDIFVPQRIVVKRSVDEDGLQTHDSRLHTEARLLRAVTLLSDLYDDYEKHSSTKTVDNPIKEKHYLGRLIEVLRSGTDAGEAVEQEACKIAAGVREKTRDSPGLVVFLKRAVWLLQQTRPGEGALVRGVMKGLRSFNCKIPSSTQH